MKKWIGVVVLTLALAVPAFAEHSGMGCPMHKEKNMVLTDAAKALEASNPDLSKKLSDMAANCCGGH